MNNYCCNICGAAAYYDGRCGDGPILMCGCDKIGSEYVPDRCGGYHTNPTGAKPVRGESSSNRKIVRRGSRTIIIIED